MTAYTLFYSDPEKEMTSDNWTALIGSIFLFCVGYYAKSLAFDDNFLYITGHKIDDKVPFEKIVKVVFIMSVFSYPYFYKVIYHDENGNQKIITVIPKWGNGFDKFNRRLKEKSKNLVEKHWPFSLS